MHYFSFIIIDLAAVEGKTIFKETSSVSYKDWIYYEYLDEEWIWS